MDLSELQEILNETNQILNLETMDDVYEAAEYHFPDNFGFWIEGVILVSIKDFMIRYIKILSSFTM